MCTYCEQASAYRSGFPQLGNTKAGFPSSGWQLWEAEGRTWGWLRGPCTAPHKLLKEANLPHHHMELRELGKEPPNPPSLQGKGKELNRKWDKKGGETKGRCKWNTDQSSSALGSLLPVCQCVEPFQRHWDVENCQGWSMWL